MLPDTRRFISRAGATEGPFTIDEIFSMAVEGKTPAHTLFWSESKKTWKPLAGLMLDVDPDRLDEFAKAGVKRVRVLGSGEKDCYYCALLAGQIFPIDSPPVLPPEPCQCVPWCRLILIAVAEET